MSATRIIAGAMSGTSADGVDIALVRIRGQGFDVRAELIEHHHTPFDAPLRSIVLEIRNSGQCRLADLAEIGRKISLTYADSVKIALQKSLTSVDDLTCIAAHGQTLFHSPPDTIQWLDPALIAQEVGCAVVSDFRRADCAVGGQGAPLVPFALHVLFRDSTRDRAFLNIGGIANVTLIPAGAKLSQIIAFDTGPGNCISDELCRRLVPAGPGYDAGGSLAGSGKVIEPIVGQFLAADYVRASPPKSTDGPAMIGLFGSLVRQAAPNASAEDLLATAAAITAGCVRLAVPESSELIVSGGGVENRAMLSHLPKVIRSDDIGVPSAAVEAMAFAILGAATLDGIPANVPSVTGARRPVVLGSITPYG